MVRSNRQPASPTAFVGTYTDGDSVGVYHLDVSTGGTPVLEQAATKSVPDNPSFLATHPDEPVVYAVHEVPEGGASAFRLDARDPGEDGGVLLTSLGRVGTGAGGPCYCSVHEAGFLLVAHFTGGAVSALPLDDDGGLGAPSDVVRHEGSGPHPEFQTEAHPHAAVPGADGRYVYVPDLGADEVVVYEFDAGDGSLDRAAAVETAPGAGPRHLTFAPDSDRAYLVNQLDSTVAAYDWDPGTGGLSERAVVSTLPDGFDGENHAGEVAVHPSGSPVYASNRGDDSIAVLEVRDDGGLRRRGTRSTRGEWPRHFALTPDGDALVVGNKDTDSVVSFGLDGDTGDPDRRGSRVPVPHPACVRMFPVGELPPGRTDNGT